MGRIQATVFAQSLSIFTCKLLIIRGGTVLILVYGVKGQGQLWQSVKPCIDTIQYKLQF